MGGNSFEVIPIRSAPVAQSCFGCTSNAGSIFCDLDRGHLSELDQLRQTVTYGAGAVVFEAGQAPRGVYCIGSGRVKISRNLPDGRGVILGFAGPGDVLGVRPLLLGRPHDLTAQTAEPARLCLIPRSGFLDCVGQHGDVSLRLAQKLSMELGDAYRQVCRAVLKPTVERLSEMLLRLCQTHGYPVSAGIGLKTNMCQDELAELVGISRRSLNRALGALREMGIIECRRRYIIVRDPAALQNCVLS